MSRLRSCISEGEIAGIGAFIGLTRGLGACMIWHKHVYAERADKYAYVQFIVD
jgi:hypothetical protein